MVMLKWWKPVNEKQKQMFDTAKDDVKIALTVCKEGVEIGKCIGIIAESVGCKTPYRQLGFDNFQHFLFHIDDILEVRVLPFDTRKFLFLRDSALNEQARHVRRLVQEQASAKTNKRGPRPTIRNTKLLSSDILLTGLPPRPSLPTSVHQGRVVPTSRFNSGPAAPRYLRGAHSSGVRQFSTTRSAAYWPYSSSLYSNKPAPTSATVPKPSVTRNFISGGTYTSYRNDSIHSFRSASIPTPPKPVQIRMGGQVTYIKGGGDNKSNVDEVDRVSRNFSSMSTKYKPYIARKYDVDDDSEEDDDDGFEMVCGGAHSKAADNKPKVLTGLKGEGDAGGGGDHKGSVDDVGCTSRKIGFTSTSIKFMVQLEDYLFKMKEIISNSEEPKRVILSNMKQDPVYPAGKGISMNWAEKKLHDPALCIPFVRIPLLEMKIFKLTQYIDMSSFQLMAITKEKTIKQTGMQMWYNQMKYRMEKIQLKDLKHYGIYAAYDEDVNEWIRVQIDLKNGVIEDLIDTMNIDNGLVKKIARENIRYLVEIFARPVRLAFRADVYRINNEPELTDEVKLCFDKYMRALVGNLFKVFVAVQMPDVYSGVPLLRTRLMVIDGPYHED